MTICRPRGRPSGSQEQRAEGRVGGGLRGSRQEEAGCRGWGPLPLLSEGPRSRFLPPPPTDFPKVRRAGRSFKVGERESEGPRDFLERRLASRFWSSLARCLQNVLPEIGKGPAPPRGSVFSSHEPTRFALKICFSFQSNNRPLSPSEKSFLDVISLWKGRRGSPPPAHPFWKREGGRRQATAESAFGAPPQEPRLASGVSAWTPASGRHPRARRLGAPLPPAAPGLLSLGPGPPWRRRWATQKASLFASE